jgi:hypothetical protein
LFDEGGARWAARWDVSVESDGRLAAVDPRHIDFLKCDRSTNTCLVRADGRVYGWPVTIGSA